MKKQRKGFIVFQLYKGFLQEGYSSAVYKFNKEDQRLWLNPNFAHWLLREVLGFPAP